MGLKLYMIEPSPAVRSVLITAKALGLQLELIRVDMAKGEHLTPEYLKLNPQHTVPTLDDNGFVIWDSHAINVYLVTKYGKDDSLYPKDPQKQAVINQRFHFNSGCLFPAGAAIIKPIITQGVKDVSPEKAEKVLEAYGFLEKFLDGKQWAAGATATLADIQLITSVRSIAVLVPIDAAKFPNITGWLSRVKSLPYYHVDEAGLKMFEGLIKSKLQS